MLLLVPGGGQCGYGPLSALGLAVQEGVRRHQEVVVVVRGGQGLEEGQSLSPPLVTIALSEVGTCLL